MDINIKLTIPEEIMEQMAKKLIEKLKPSLANNGKAEADIIFDVKGLCEYLSVSPKWVYDKTHFKELPHYKVGGLLRFRKKDIDKWLNAYSVPAINGATKTKPIKR